ncbi:polymorphic toxin-type HINT domain-containing protein [Nocardiopsis ansamitocini]|uniref:Intein C-terminal splicing domain-containing protein n=1 Tax=Nocardiopsis ansamitocini TaxID=1670832 RepID=A0A9W6P205_9ACTN|nr:polymorphic toxin-type HINT domain-containing protein [Nocardiopsis ansamitocini]GLU45651.1 hypothetical protein Nans01_00020 [Nocardiopsis ansamitocini]
MPATPVLLADGSSAPIASLSVGANVMATDPQAGVEGAREVVATHVGTGAKRMVEVWINPASEKAPNPLGAPLQRGAEESEGSDGAQGVVGEPVVATANHEFWVADLGEWVAAGELAEGMWLRTPTDTWVQIEQVKQWTVREQRVHNLTIQDVHTYHVRTGETAVLVHNNNCIVGSKQFDHSWDQHSPRGAYQKDGKMENVLANGIDKPRFREMVNEAIASGVKVPDLSLILAMATTLITISGTLKLAQWGKMA